MTDLEKFPDVVMHEKGEQVRTLIEVVAEAMWQEESSRVAGRRRRISWENENDTIRYNWRNLATVAVATVEAHRAE